MKNLSLSLSLCVYYYVWILQYVCIITGCLLNALRVTVPHPWHPHAGKYSTLRTYCTYSTVLHCTALYLMYILQLYARTELHCTVLHSTSPTSLNTYITLIHFIITLLLLSLNISYVPPLFMLSSLNLIILQLFIYTVFSATMALLDAGVPLKNPVAGLSIGLVTSDKLEKAFPLGDQLPSPVSTFLYCSYVMLMLLFLQWVILFLLLLLF